MKYLRGAGGFSVVAAIVAAFVLALFLPTGFRAVIVLPIALFVPGAALASGTLRRENPVAWLVLSIVISLASFSLVAVALSVLGIPLTPTAVALVTVFLVAVGAIVTRRIHRDAIEELSVRPIHLVPFVSVALAVAGVFVVFHALPAPASPFVEFALRGSAAGGRPLHVERGRPVVIQFAVRNDSDKRVKITVTPSVDRLRLQPTTLSDSPNHTALGAITIPASFASHTRACLTHVVLSLRDSGNLKLRVTVSLWLTPSAAAAQACTQKSA